MTQKNQIYKCAVCGNMVEIVHPSSGNLVCCGQPMVLQQANATDGAVEKHVPVIKKTDTGFIVSVGSVLHPMEEKHYIEWIEVVFDDGKVGRKYLKPGEEPTVQFFMNRMPAKVYAYCNLHGLWSN